MARVEVLVGPERRRCWTAEQKQELVAAAFAPGARVADVARRADIGTGQIYRWRESIRAAANGFAELVVTAGAPATPGDAIEIEFAHGARVRIPASTRVELARAVVAALARS